MKKNWDKQIALFLSSQSLSLFGSSLVQYAIMWYITLNTKSGIMMGISILCGFLPTFVISPLAGVWADRYNRKILIILSDLFIAACTLLMAVLFFMGYNSIVLLFILSACRAMGTGIQTPTVNAFIPNLVPADKLEKVNGINSSIQALTMLLSPLLSGALFYIATIEAIFFIDVITAAIAVLIMALFLKVPVHAKAQTSQTISYFADLTTGINYIKKESILGKLFTFYGVIYFLATPVCFLAPLQVARSFGSEVWRLTGIEVAFSLGMIIGGIIITSGGGFKNRMHTVTLSSFIIGISTIILGNIPIVLPKYWLYTMLMAVTGMCMALYNISVTTFLQEKIEVDFQGRVFGVLGMISSSAMPVGMLLFGPVADIMRIEWLLIATGALIFLQSLFMLGSKELFREARLVSKGVEG
ncbi:MAG: enterobactin exporter EntS [Firmicutes bacterium ADurb.Bin419]|nr:MAG: enterobactin exporter EntS [Firmicutes bacterium ADurb.Bin419]